MRTCPGCEQEKKFPARSRFCSAACYRKARYEGKPDALADDAFDSTVLAELSRGVTGVCALSENLDRSESSVRKALESLRTQGNNIRIEGDSAELSGMVEPGAGEPFIVHNVSSYDNQWTKFGATGDNHLGSKHERLDVLNALYDVYEAEGITTVYNTGNWIEGNCRLNYHDVRVIGLDDQIDYMIEHYPKREGITTLYVAGDDHEGWWQKAERIEIGRYLESRARAAGREDLKYLGYVEADVELKAKNGSAWLKIMHPGGGSAYAHSYAPQKLVESFQGGEKPNVLLIGHYHKFEHCFPRDVHVLQTGCTCFSGEATVETASGPKRIRNVSAGDMVLTHSNQFKPVTKVYKRPYCGEMIRLNFGRKRRSDNQITATPEHPIAVVDPTTGGYSWQPISSVAVGEWVAVRAKECSICQKPVPYWVNVCPAHNCMDRADLRKSLSERRGGFKRQRANGGCLASHLESDIVPFCEKMVAEGWRIVPVGGCVIPDAIGFKDGRVVAFEIEKATGNYLEFKKDKYVNATINQYVDSVEWINPTRRKRQRCSEFIPIDELPGFVAVRVLSVEHPHNGAARNRNKPKDVFNLEVEGDHTYVASHVLVHNCDQSIFMRKQKIQAHVGGCIVWLNQAPDGSINRFRSEWLPFFDRDFYKNKRNFGLAS